MQKIGLMVIGAAVLITGIYGGFVGHESLPWAGIVGALLCFAFSDIRRIESFKASRSGIEARTRAVLDEAQATVEELQVLARNLAEITLSLIKRSGRLGGYSDIEQEEIKDQMLGILTKVGINAKVIPDVLKQWNNFEAMDYAFGILGNSRIPEGASDEEQKEWKSLRNQTDTQMPPTPDDLKNFLDRSGFLTPERAAYIEDYEYFLRNKRHRRQDVWRARRDWGHLVKTTKISLDQSQL